MVASLAADLVVVLHLAFILFVLFGGLLVAWRRWVAVPHLVAVLWGAGIEFFGGICPLTPLENALRRRAGEAGYAEGFIEHYLLPLIYPAGLTHEVGVVLGLGVLVLNAGIYAYVIRRGAAR